jgi:hypothetical protein
VISHLVYFESRITLSPEEIASMHPRLYHITRPNAVSSIRKHGLLSTSRLLTIFDVPTAERESIEAQRRPTNITIGHPVYGEVTITDNGPLSDGIRDVEAHMTGYYSFPHLDAISQSTTSSTWQHKG